MNEMEYAGFWIRVLASLIDTLLVGVIILPIMYLIYGPGYWGSASIAQGFWDVVFNYLLPALAVIVFWTYRSATPGKMITGLSIVDANSGGKPTTMQFVVRYLGYYVSMLPLFLGFLWVAIDKRKQGLHDKIARTLVIKRSAVVSGAPDQEP